MITKVIIIKITILSFSLFLLAGCDSDRFSQVVEVEIPEHESRLVLNARFSSLDTGVTALVANSLGILDTSAYDIPEDAAVRLFRDGEWVGGDFFFLPDKLKYFLSLDEPLGTAPRLYRMEVSAPGYEPISAEQVMPVPASIQSLRVERDGAIDGEGRRADGIEVQLNDPADEENYYALAFFYEISEGQPGGDTITYSNPVYASTLDQVVQYGYHYEQVFTDKSFNGSSYTVSLYTYQGALPEGQGNARLVARLYTLSRDAFLYDLSLRQYYDALDNPFAEPVTVHSNIEGGYGIFALSSVAEESVVLD
ncbi:MAG: DUF4249 domain-containing protein [Lewinellaceae bacterium]|nr:DUF4249 domain-containing protein [Phaeodactylibacter sp.]MCB0613344.1 DUF4249 domain-containing protein [Phaeodactylibacter sp.]MCB9346887.1 DUF4249 domain-containing protein [Lewinellaceae bacterium]